MGCTAWARRMVCEPASGQAEVFDLTRLDQVFHSAPRDVLDRHRRIEHGVGRRDRCIDFQTFERSFRDLSDVFGSAVEARPTWCATGLELEAEFRGDNDSIAEGRQRLADELFVVERAVNLGRIEERDALVDRGANRDSISCLSQAGPYAKVMPMQPSPSARLRGRWFRVYVLHVSTLCY